MSEFHNPAIFGVQCDAIARSGKRCKRLNRWEIPCSAVYDARFNSYRADRFSPVRLCCCHKILESKLRKQGKRLKLHHGGYLGCFNKYNYGQLVITTPTVDWSKAKTVKVPKFWSQNL